MRKAFRREWANLWAVPEAPWIAVFAVLMLTMFLVPVFMLE